LGTLEIAERGLFVVGPGKTNHTVPRGSRRSDCGWRRGAMRGARSRGMRGARSRGRVWCRCRWMGRGRSCRRGWFGRMRRMNVRAVRWTRLAALCRPITLFPGNTGVGIVNVTSDMSSFYG
jgi:hypothetical protein